MAQTKPPFPSFVILDLFLAHDTINHWQPPLPSGETWSWTSLLGGPAFLWHSWGARSWWSHEAEDSEHKRGGGWFFRVCRRKLPLCSLLEQLSRWFREQWVEFEENWVGKFFLHAYVLSHFSRVQLFVILWTLACQAPLSMGILQARMLEWVTMPSSGGSSWSRDWTHVSCGSCIAGGFITTEPLVKPQLFLRKNQNHWLKVWKMMWKCQY